LVILAKSSMSVIPDKYSAMICCFLVLRWGRAAAARDGVVFAGAIGKPFVLSASAGVCQDVKWCSANDPA
jgi:hypothetical protein